MNVAYSYRYGRFAKGIIFFLMAIWTLLIGVLLLYFTGQSGGVLPIAISMTIILLFFVISIAIVFLVLGFTRVSGSSKAKQIRKNGKSAIGAIGSLKSKTIYYQGLITTKKVVFYYKGEDGQIGRTTELINGKIYRDLKETFNRELPIKVLGNRAVLDYDKILSK